MGDKVKETKLNVGDKERETKLKGADKVREAKLNAKLMKLSREDERVKRSYSTDSRNLKLEEKMPRKSFEKQEGGQEKSTREGFIANAKTQPCLFFAKGFCMRGATCWFKHEKLAEDISREEVNFEEEKRTSQVPRHMLLCLVDYTVTVKTLDLEEYFSQFGEVLEVKFTGLSQEGWSNFNLEVRWADNMALKALQKQSHCIKGTDVMVRQSRSKDSRSCSRGGIVEENKETGRSWRGREETWRNKKRSRSRMRSRSKSRISKRSRSRSPLSRSSKSYKREGGMADVRRKAETKWRGSSQSKMEETDALMRKEIKLESLQGEPCPELLAEVSRDQVKIKKEVKEFARASDAVPEDLKESDHLARLLKEDQENGASPKKVMELHLKEDKNQHYLLTTRSK